MERVSRKPGSVLADANLGLAAGGYLSGTTVTSRL